jgi:hypothetical protein
MPPGHRFGAPCLRRLRVNLRHERFVPTGPLNLDLPPLQTHPQAAAVRLLWTFFQRTFSVARTSFKKQPERRLLLIRH